MFLVAILFLNLLIAIIVDSYTIVGQHAETSFWTQRMLFILDVNQMQKFFKCTSRNIGLKSKASPSEDNRSDESCSMEPFFSNWERILSCFHDKRLVNKNGESTPKYWKLFILRCTCIIIIPIWLLLGVVSAGYLWPRQVREWLFFACSKKEVRDLPADMEHKILVNAIENFRNEILIANQTMSSCLLKLNNKLDETQKQMQVEEKKLSNVAISIDCINDKMLQLAFELGQIKSDLKEAKGIESAENLMEIRLLKSELNDVKNLLMNVVKGA